MSRLVIRMNFNIADELENLLIAERALRNPYGFTMTFSNTPGFSPTPVFVQTVSYTPFGNVVTTTVSAPANVFNHNGNAVTVVNGQIVPIGFGCPNMFWR